VWSSVQNPHFNNRGYIDVTAKYRCYTGTGQLSASVILWGCGTYKPRTPLTEGDLQRNCYKEGTNSRTFSPPTTGTTYGNPVTAPPNSFGSVHQWYVACSMHTTSGSTTVLSWSNIVYL